MNKPIDIGELAGFPPTTDHEIKELYCVLSRGPDGNEGICSTNMGGMELQACTSDKRILELIMGYFRQADKPDGITLRACKFTLSEELCQL